MTPSGIEPVTLGNHYHKKYYVTTLSLDNITFISKFALLSSSCCLLVWIQYIQ